jgi:hypothetical protein
MLVYKQAQGIAQQDMAHVDIAAVLKDLAKQRPIFHSEADFQHALAWELHRRIPEVDVRLEVPKAHAGKLLHIDIWIAHGETALALELKYKTRELSVEIGGETFNLRSQSAQDLGRYDFIKDVQRLEQLCRGRANLVGYALFLTNDSSYWRQAPDAKCADGAYRIPEGRVIRGELAWAEHAGMGTTHGRQEPLIIRGAYTIQWRDYSRPFGAAHGRFRYTALKVRG